MVSTCSRVDCTLAVGRSPVIQYAAAAVVAAAAEVVDVVAAGECDLGAEH